MSSTEQFLDYVVVDVFANSPFSGNPLAVIFGADDLSTEQLQAIAIEFNLSETTFPVALTDADRGDGADYRLRIFTPESEIPFAGHPTLGSAWALRAAGRLEPGRRVQACGAGLIGVELPADPDDEVELTAVPRDRARALSDAEIAAVSPLVGLKPSDVVGPAYTAGCGLSWLYLEVTPDAVTRSRPSGTRLDEVEVDLSGVRDPIDGIDVFAVASSVEGDLMIDCRVFVPGFGIPEDPATGSAAAGLGVALVATGYATPDGRTSFAVTQGAAMGRPSRLRGTVQATAGVATHVQVAGNVVPIARGQIRVPDRIS